MRNIVHRLQTFGLYLLPAALLMLCGALLTALLYRPNPPIRSVVELPAAEYADLTDDEYWRIHAEEMFMLLLADALRQSQFARETEAQILMYRLPAGSNPQFLHISPYLDGNGQMEYPVLIRL